MFDHTLQELRLGETETETPPLADNPEGLAKVKAVRNGDCGDDGGLPRRPRHELPFVIVGAGGGLYGRFIKGESLVGTVELQARENERRTDSTLDEAEIGVDDKETKAVRRKRNKVEEIRATQKKKSKSPVVSAVSVCYDEEEEENESRGRLRGMAAERETVGESEPNNQSELKKKKKKRKTKRDKRRTLDHDEEREDRRNNITTHLTATPPSIINPLEKSPRSKMRHERSRTKREGERSIQDR